MTQELLTFPQSQALLFEAAPDFQAFWQAYLIEEDFGSESPSACRFFSVLADYIDQKIRDQQCCPLAEIFSLIEQLMLSGDENVKTAAATCFLENLQNQEAPPEVWVPLLGLASSDFCKAWDEFTGVATPGLWPDGMPLSLSKIDRLNLDLNQALNQLFKVEPEYKKYWQQHSKVAEQPTLSTEKATYQLSLVAQYLNQQIVANPSYQPGAVLEQLEMFNLQGDDALRSGVAMGFTNQLFELQTPVERWMPLLGPTMQAYAQAWAEVLGLSKQRDDQPA